MTITPEMIAANDRIRAAQSTDIAKSAPVPDISGSVSDRMARTERLFRESVTTGNFAHEPVLDTTSALANRGYPKRHIKRLSVMDGPSYSKAVELLSKVTDGDCIIALIGNRGPGKTQMAVMWADRLARLGRSIGYYRKTADIIGEIKATWGDKKRSEEDVLNKYRTCGYLVLDEFSEKGASEWESRVLVNIIDHRYDNELVTVIIANMSQEQAQKEIHPSILSRAEETGGLVVCDWLSYRTP